MKYSPLTVPFIQEILNLDSGDKIKLSKEKHITSLWAGYGEVNSIVVNCPRSKSGSTKIPLIIKRVTPPSNSSSVGNQRKIRSYHIEAYFYDTIAPSILKLNDDGILSCPIAIPYSIEKTEEDEESPSFTFVLSDLTDEYSEYSSYPGLSIEQTKAAISWLAAFHAIFYKNNTSTSTTVDNAKIWAEGGYWHLKTRLDELAQISSSSSSSNQRMFHNSAFAIDERMNANANSLTLVHGDFKEANILFGKEKCAVVDFQYCGRGYGAKDLVMLIVSSVSGRILDSNSNQMGGEDGLLRFYADELRRNLVSIGELDSDEIEKVASFDILKMQYELALVDYVRFMMGWGMWGTNSDYAGERAVEILNDIALSWSGNNDDDDGRKKSSAVAASLTEEDWTSAINEKYSLDLF